ESLAARLGPVETPLDPNGALELTGALEALGWTDETSLLTKRLSYQERRVALEADAIAGLVLARQSGGSAPVERRPGPSSRPVVVVDARCLQDPVYRGRGVGEHGHAVLKAVRQAAPDHDLLLLVDAEMPMLL